MDDPLRCREMAVSAVPRIRDPETWSRAAQPYELERLRDPSHTRALPEDEFRAMFAAVGRDTRQEADWEQPMPVEHWFEQAKTPNESRDRVRAAFLEEADGGEETGLRATQGDDGLTITQRWLLLGG